LLTRVKTIPRIGTKTSLMLVVLTDGFERLQAEVNCVVMQD